VCVFPPAPLDLCRPNWPRHPGVVRPSPEANALRSAARTPRAGAGGERPEAACAPLMFRANNLFRPVVRCCVLLRFTATQWSLRRFLRQQICMGRPLGSACWYSVQRSVSAASRHNGGHPDDAEVGWPAPTPTRWEEAQGRQEKQKPNPPASAARNRNTGRFGPCHHHQDVPSLVTD
jgi:hypothetical protein